MIDLVLADELQAAVNVRLVDPHPTGRQRNAQSRRLLVLDLQVDVDIRIRIAAIAGIIVEPAVEAQSRRAVVDEELLGRHFGSTGELDLFRLVVANGDRALHVVQMVLEELSFLHPRGGCGHSHLFLHHLPRVDRIRRHHVYVPSDQFQFGIGIGCPAPVVEGDPAVEVQGRIIFVELHHIVGMPIDPIGHIGDCHLLGLASLGIYQPDQGGPGDETFRQLGEVELAHLIQSNDSHTTILGLQDDIIRSGEENALIAAPILGDEFNLLVNVFLHQLLAANDVVFVILFQYRGAFWVGQGAEKDAGGVNLSSHIRELHLVHAPFQLKRTGIADQRDILVVDCQFHRGSLSPGVRNQARPPGRVRPCGRSKVLLEADACERQNNQDGDQHSRSDDESGWFHVWTLLLIERRDQYLSQTGAANVRRTLLSSTTRVIVVGPGWQGGMRFPAADAA